MFLYVLLFCHIYDSFNFCSNTVFVQMANQQKLQNTANRVGFIITAVVAAVFNSNGFNY